MKRKRREVPSPLLLDDVPKRPKVQAQRKFAQNSNVNSPAITPIRDLEAANLLPSTSVLPDPVELLPMKRPNTEDFLTFLCFRGTPILPPSLNFFNTASIVTDGQVHEIKGNTSPKNGPIDIAKCAGTSAEKPFIAFGVRKRADPIVISKQMERKRRHALALQTLRRRYQEQKMAKIRALTISKLSEKTTNKTTVKTNTIQKTETVTKKDNITLQKTKVIATKHVKVTTQTLKTALRPKIKPKMCLRSFGGRFVQKELPFRKRQRIVEDSKQQENNKKKIPNRKTFERKEKQKSEVAKKIIKSLKYTDKKNKTGNVRVTRSGIVQPKATPNITRQQMKKRILLSTTNTLKPIVKSKLRSSTLKSTVISQKKGRQGLRIRRSPQVEKVKERLERPIEPKRSSGRGSNNITKKSFSKDDKGVEVLDKTSKSEKKEVKKNVNIKKTVNTSNKSIETKKNIDIKKSSKVTSEKQKSINLKKFKKEVNKSLKKTTEVFVSRLRSKGSEKPKVFSPTFQNKDFKKADDNKIMKSTVESKNKKSEDECLKKQANIRDTKNENKEHDKTKSNEKQWNKKEIKECVKKCSGKTALINKDDLKIEPKPEKICKKENNKKPERNTALLAGNEQIKKTDIDILCDKVQNITATDEEVSIGDTINSSSEKKSGNFKSKEKIDFEKKAEKNLKLDVKDNMSNIEISNEIQLYTSENKDREANIIKDNKTKVVEKKTTLSANTEKQLSATDREANIIKGDKTKVVEKKTELSANTEKYLSASDVQEIVPSISQEIEDKSEGNTTIVDKTKGSKELLPVISHEIDDKSKGTTMIVDLPEKIVPKEVLPFISQEIEDKSKGKTNIVDKPKKMVMEILSPISQEIEDKSKEKTIIVDKPKKNLPKESLKEIEDKSTEKTIIVDKPKKMVLPKKPKLPMNASVRKKELKKQITEESTQKISQRPSRKTKEAAAIYMEILSHKLVNDEIFDDDNNSIDSFPELPNARKTEQRENELKAQAKTTCIQEKLNEQLKTEDTLVSIDKKDDKFKQTSGEGSKVQENVAKEAFVQTPKQDANCGKDETRKETKRSKIICDIKNESKLELISYEELNKCNVKKFPEKKENIKKQNEKDSSPEQKKNFEKHKDEKLLEQKKTIEKQNKECKPLEKKKSIEKYNKEVNVVIMNTDKSSPEHKEEGTKFGLRKRKSYQETFIDFDSESDDEILQEKIKKLTMKKLNKKEPTEVFEKRQTRGLTQIFVESTDTDESFYAEIRVPRNKKLTRSKGKIPVSENIEKEKLGSETAKDKTIDKKEKPVKCDSDESIESNTNLKSLQLKQSKKILSKSQGKSKKSSANFSDSDEEPLSKLTADKSVKSCEESEECKNKKIKKKSSLLSTRDTKPKRECAKRPQNYLPMPSSSEDEEYFHGFTTIPVKEEIKQPIAYVVETLPPSLDLLEKDLGRKGKVNMSNEQIEQWLKDSALAGSGVAKENDEMLKFGEKIPVERGISIQEEISDKVDHETVPKEVKIEDIVKPGSSITTDIGKPTKSETKSSPGDRKLIFKKERKDLTPTISAFSPENERSVYAFGDDVEETVSTPFRRPSRRPSSTATSRSEDESSKHEESLKPGHFRKPPPQIEHSEDFRCFNVPQNPSLSKLGKPQKSESMVAPASITKKPPKLHIEKFPESFDEGKYKVPSSPSASSSSSAKLSKKSIPKPRNRAAEVVTPIYVSDFPKASEPGKLVEAPVFHPTEQEFQDPLEYIERIRHKAEQFGICKIVPPSSFKPECKVSDEMRFTAYNQYVHKMLHRWGPNFKEFMAIKKYLATQNITLKQPPWIGGMEIDLPRLYQTVQSLGGLKEVIEKKKWPKVSDCMKIPKSAQDRVTKLDDIYCKYLLPYDTLSPAEREKLFDEVETDWAKRESKSLLKTDEKNLENFDEEEESDVEVDECIVKGRNMALSAFYRIARNTMAMHFKTAEPTAQEVEEEFWKYVTQKQNYICVHSASIDCGIWGYGFAVTKNSPFGKHAWNLKVLSNNNHSVLKSLGPAMGVTVPTLHVGMVFSACCWYRDPHGLPWIEYLHTGGNKIWYGVPNATCDQFHAALKKLVPNYCRDKELWLPSDTAMVPPGLLMENNVSLSRSVQEPGQFIVVFPKVFTSSISTGYVVSESVYFAPHYWLKSAKSIFNELKSSCEPSMFSLDKLLLKIAADPKSNMEVLRIVTPYIHELYSQEKDLRSRLHSLGKIAEEKISSTEAIGKKRKKLQFGNEVEFECEICRTNLYVSMVIESQNDMVYCLEHAIELAQKEPKVIDFLKLQYNYSEKELEEITFKVATAIEVKMQKKTPNKYGMPIFLTK